MVIVYILGILLLGYGLLFLLVPKGNLLHEIIHLPPYLLKTKALDVSQMKEAKHKLGTHFRQYLLHFYPTPSAPERNQVIIYLHGGGWQFGRPEMFQVNAKVFTDLGYHVFCISYRRLPWNNFETMHQDLSKGLTKVLHLMKSHDLEGKKICMGGMSAGAHLVAMLLYDRENLASLGLRQMDFSGLFLCGAPLDLRQMNWTPSLYFLAGKKGSTSFKKASPIEYLQADEQTPIIAIHGTKDGLVHYQAGATFAERLKKINPKLVEFHTLKNGTHLDAAKWAVDEDEVRKWILEWMEKLERGIEKGELKIENDPSF